MLLNICTALIVCILCFSNVKTQQVNASRITTLLVKPFIMEKNVEGVASREEASTNARSRYEGYLVDLLEELQQRIGFSYELHVVQDSKYGAMQEDGMWSGMIGELVTDKADFALAPLTITYERQTVVDFTRPYMQANLAFISRQFTEKNEARNLLFLLRPLDRNVWLLILVTLLVTMFVMSFTTRQSPYGWKKTYRRGAASKTQGDTFSLANTFWIVLSGLVLQGYMSQPRAASGKIILGTWWLFSLLVVSAYISGLSASLHQTSEDSRPTSLSDLVSGKGYQVGVVKDAASNHLLEHSRIPSLARLWQRVQKDDSYVTTPDEGMERARQQNYMFITDMPIAEYNALNEPCDLLLLGGSLSQAVLGLAVSRNSPLKVRLDLALSKLAEDSTLDLLRQRWWRPQCPDVGGQASWGTPSTGPEVPIGLYRMSFAFLAYACGLILCFIVVCVENIIFKRSKRRHQSPRSLQPLEDDTSEMKA